MSAYSFAGLRVAVQLVPANVPTEYIRNASDVARLVGEDAKRWDREHFLVIGLDNKNRCLGIEVVAIGTGNVAHIPVRDVMRPLLLAGALRFIVCHNHPSGELAPSQADVAITRSLTEAAELFGIELVDHVIVGPGDGYASFQELRLMMP